MRYLFAFLTTFLLASVNAQVTTIPAFPTADDTVEIVYDATLGTSGLQGASSVHIHTGVITDGPNSSNWQHVVGQWGNPNSPGQMTSLGNDKWSIKFVPRDYYASAGLSASATVYRLGMVFRESGPCGGFSGNSDPCAEGKSPANGDIFVEISDGGFEAAITQPTFTPVFVDPNGTLQVRAESSINADLSIFVNTTLANQATGTQVVNATINAANFGVGRHDIYLVATDGVTTIRDTSYFIVRANSKDQPVPSGFEYGINYLPGDTSVQLLLHAPGKDFVYVIGDFNNWQVDPAYRMFKDATAGVFHLQVNGLNPGEEYAFQYYIDEEGMRVADVYAEKYLDPWNDQWISSETYPNLKPYPVGKTDNIVSILQTAQTPYPWDTGINYQKPPKDNLIIYELLVRDFVHKRSYNALIDTLDYLEDLGINAIQLMPVMEFEGNESWGYNPMFFFAPDKYYGTKDDLKRFVEECHRRDIAVILDIALNHSFGLNPQVRMYFDPTVGDFGQTTPDNPWFNPVPTHDFNVGYDYNHESPHTRQFSKRVMGHWIEEYKIDGYRFDLSKGFTQRNTLGNIGAWNAYDQSRVDIWQDYQNHIYSIDNSCYMIMEHLGDNSEERELANRGMMPWGIMHSNFKECVLGYNNNKVDINWLSWQNRGYNDPHLIGYAVSHDEERLMVDALQFGNSAGGYDVTDEATALSRIEAVHTILMAVPGPKMYWQFDEIGYDISINFNGRTGNKPLVWNYLNEPNRKRLYDVTAAVSKLKRDEPAFRTRNFNLDGGGIGKRVHLYDGSMDVVVCANFDVVDINMVPGFNNTGWWYEYFTGDSMNVTDLNATYNFGPGDYKLWTSKRLGEVTINPPDTSNNISVQEIIDERNLNAFPNPFTNTLQINLEDYDDVNSIAVYNLKGELVKELYNASTSNLNEVVYWDATNSAGTQVNSGTYLLRVIDKGEPISRKIMYFKQ